MSALPIIFRFADPAALAEGAAAYIAELLAGAIRQQGLAALTLAGGSTPRAMYERLATKPVAWEHVLIRFGDERCVPPDDPASNYRMAKEALLDRIAIPSKHVARMRGELPPEQAADHYQAVLADEPGDDVLVLGMGDDGHTASLFPDTRELPAHRNVMATRSPAPPHDRISLTLPRIRAAATRVLLVAGAGKAARLAEVYAQVRDGRPVLPAAAIGPAIWMLDEAAARALPGDHTC